MALKLADRIKQFTTTSGTGDVSFTGTPTGFATFGSVLTNGDTTYYCIEENDKWEVGIGTYGSDNMTRDLVLSSSNGGSYVSLGGSGVVFITYPADKSFYKDLQSQIVVGASGFLFNNGTTFKDANIIELTDVDTSGTISSSHLLAFNNTNKSLLLGESTGASLENNTFVGYGAGSGITTATNSVSIGTDAGASNTTGAYNVSVGSFAGPYEFAYAGSVSNSVSVGYQAGSRMRTDSTAIGYKAGSEAYELGFVAIGSSAGYQIGSYSVAIGKEAAYSTSEDYVVAIGYQAAKDASGESSTWLGHSAGHAATGVSYSIGLGYQAGKSSSANDSIYIGKSAGQSNSSNDYLYIGNGSPSSSRTLIKGDMQSKRLAIGAADVTLADTLYIGVPTSTDKGLVVKAAVSQSADLTDWQTSAGASVASLTHSGVLTVNSVFASGQGVQLTDNTPVTTTNTIYNAGGKLYFSGTDMSPATGVSGKVGFFNSSTIIYDNDFSFDSTNKALTVGNADLRENFISVGGDANGSGVFGNIELHQDVINFNNQNGLIRIGDYASVDTGVSNSNYAVMIGGFAGLNASGATNSIIVGRYAGHGSTNLSYATSIGTMSGLSSSGNYSVFVGQTAGNQSSGVYNTFIGPNAGKKVVGNRNVEILASGESTTSILNGYDNKLHVQELITGDVPSRKVAVGNVSASTLSPDGTLEVLPKTNSDVGIIVQGAASHTANLQEWQTSNAVAVAHVAIDGSIATSGTIAASGGVLLDNIVPAVTTNKLYNDAGTLKFNGSAIGGGSVDAYTSGVAAYASGQAIENETDLVYVSGSAVYSSGQAIQNETDIAYTSGVATYASGQAIENEGLATYASGLSITNELNVAYASGQAIQNEIDIAYTSGIATYASGNTIVNDGLIAYASGNTANIAFGSNAEGDILYHNGSSFVRLGKGTDDYVLKMNGNVPNWEAESGGGGVDAYTSGVAAYSSGVLTGGIPNFNVVGINTASPEYGIDVTGGGASGVIQATGIKLGASGVVFSDGTTQTTAGSSTVNAYVSGVAAYASGQAIENEGLATYASGLAITNELNVAYASGQAIANETDLVYVSGAAAYSSGNTIVNDGLIAYASGNTANIAFGSNAEGDMLYHNGSSFVRLAKGTDNYILKMSSNTPNWEAEPVSSTDFNYVSGVANYASGQAIENELLVTYASGQAIDNETDLVYVSGAAAYSSGVLTGGIPNFNQVGVNTASPAYGVDVTGGGYLGLVQATGVLGGASGIWTPKINYTDGDASMTIADGGKVTFSAGFAVGSDAEGDILYHNGTSYIRLAKGTDNHVLTMDGNVPNWEAAGGGSPAGSDTQIQFNDGGSFGGDSDLVWNNTTNVLTINGTIAASLKAFVIDHPTKENMKLQYACLEGPENGVYIRGVVEGGNIIELPDYWVGLVDENSITVQLTAKGYSQPSIFVDRIEDNTVYLVSEQRINAYYVVHATRKDVSPLEVECPK